MPRTFRLLVALTIALLPARALAQRVQLSVEDRDIYAGLPFVLSVVADGFDEDPEPTVSELQIPGAHVEFIGMSPNVSSSITIINGRRSEEHSVTFSYRYRVNVAKPGRYEVPAVVVRQGSKKAESRPAQFEATELDTTRDMKIRVGLPERPVWIGESFEMTIDWLLRSDPNDPHFVIPIFDLEDQFQVAAPEPAGRKTLAFQVGARELELPYERSEENIGGVPYHRFRFFAIVTPQRAGSLALPPAAVVARLRVGTGRDSFGFRTARMRIFKAEDDARTLEVRPVPAQGKPTSFAGAVGEQFSIEAQASRTVVRVGDPIELKILVRSTGGLEGLRLPPLSGPDALPKEQFEVPEELPPGEPTDDGTGKVFRVPIRLRSTAAREIPALPFSYFAPKQGRYQTIRTQPIALSIAGSSVVDAKDVVSATKSTPAESEPNAAGATVIDADLSLSSEGDTMSTVLSTGTLMPILAALYLAPLILFGVRVWQVRTRERRGQGAEVRKARRAVEAAVANARSAPARDAAPELKAALKALAAATGIKLSGPIIDRLETDGYRPEAATQPLDPDLVADVAAVARTMAKSSPGKNAAAAATVLAVLVASTGVAWAASVPAAVTEARQLYDRALGKSDRRERVAAFTEAESKFRALNEGSPGRPELLADWGNAALGARDFGTAALAYRRALALDPGLHRAKANLSWLRKNGPAKHAASADTGAADALFFWHKNLSNAQKHLVAALAFALFVLAMTPFSDSPSRRRRLRRLGLVPAVVAIAMFASIAATDPVTDDVVVLDPSAVLRSADNLGAPPVRALPLGAGAEAEAIDQRDEWVRVRVTDGTTGWLQRRSLAFVANAD